MGGLIRTIKDAVSRQMVEGLGAHFKTRGLALPIDPYLEGTIRFGKKIEAELPIIAPDNKFKLSEDAVYATDRVTLDRDAEWVDAGGYISISLRELHRVEDVIDNTIVLSTTLLADHPVNTEVFHYSNPVQAEGSYSAGNSIINLDSTTFLVRGDVIGITPDLDLDISFVTYTITSIRSVGFLNGLLQYQVVLDSPIHRDVADGEILQVLAYPGYVSQILRIPQAPAAQLPVVGPYLVDWFSAPFTRDLEVTEYQTIQQYNVADLPVGPPFDATKNSEVLHVPIRADQFLWWTKVYGSIKYDGDVACLIAIPDANGYWWLKYDCVPSIEVPATYARGLIVTVAKSALANNEGFRLPDDVDAVWFEYKVDGTYVATASAAAHGVITVSSIPNDNDTVVLDDGFGTVVTFEFQRTGAFVPADPTYRTVDVQTSVLFTDVAIALEQTVNAVGTLGITAVNTGPVLDLYNTSVSTLGNTTITIVGPVWVVTNFTGGTDPVSTIDLTSVSTALEVAQQTAAAINRSDLHVNAAYPTIANSVEILSTVKGPAGNGPITENVADAGFIVQGMTAGVGGTSWSFHITPEYDALLRVRFYPNSFQDFNLTGGATTVVNVEILPSDSTVERIDILLKSAAGSEIYMGDWGVTGARVSALQHTYVAHVFGERNFACSGLLAKPLFHSKEDVRVYYDSGATYDSGGVRF